MLDPMLDGNTRSVVLPLQALHFFNAAATAASVIYILHVRLSFTTDMNRFDPVNRGGHCGRSTVWSCGASVL